MPAGLRNGIRRNSSVSTRPTGWVVNSGSVLPSSASPCSTSHGPSSSGTPSSVPSIRIGSCLAIRSTKSNDGPDASASSTTRPRQQADRLLVGVDLAPAERLRHQPPVRRVLRRVELHHRAPGRRLLVVHLLQADPVGAGEALDVAAHAQQVGVARHGPEPAATGVVLRPPADRVVAPQAAERGVGNAVHVRVRVGDVGVGRPQVAVGCRTTPCTRSRSISLARAWCRPASSCRPPASSRRSPRSAPGGSAPRPAIRRSRSSRRPSTPVRPRRRSRAS